MKTPLLQKTNLCWSFHQLWQFHSSTPIENRGFLHTLLHRRFSVCCDFTTFHLEIDNLNIILRKTIILWSLIRVLNHSLINCVHLKSYFRMYLKEMFLLSCCSLEVFYFKLEKFQKVFTDKLTSCNLKLFSRHLLQSKSFLPSRISYLRNYFQDLFTCKSMVTAMLPIMARPNIILNVAFVNI